MMPPQGDYSSRKEWEIACWQKLLDSTDLIDLLTTPHERRDFVMRAAALNMIMSGKSYREIGRELWLSPQTISGLKKALEEKIYRSYLERSKTERKKRVYSSKPDKLQPKHRGIPRRTKYGKIYI